MNTRTPWKTATLSLLAAAGFAPAAFGQAAPAAPAAPAKTEESLKLEKFVVTGSLI